MIFRNYFFSIFNGDSSNLEIFSDFPELKPIISDSFSIPIPSSGESIELDAIEGTPLAKNIFDIKRNGDIQDENNNFHTYILGMFGSDGNNCDDGIQLASLLSKAFSWFDEEYSENNLKFKRPASWNKLLGSNLNTSRKYSSNIYY